MVVGWIYVTSCWAQIQRPSLVWALADFSGYIAADELYDGPYCVLSIVDHRKMQKMIYRVRTQQHIHARIAIDMLHDAQATGRFDTTQTLHHARTG